MCACMYLYVLFFLVNGPPLHRLHGKCVNIAVCMCARKRISFNKLYSFKCILSGSGTCSQCHFLNVASQCTSSICFGYRVVSLSRFDVFYPLFPFFLCISCILVFSSLLRCSFCVEMSYSAHIRLINDYFLNLIPGTQLQLLSIKSNRIYIYRWKWYIRRNRNS